MMSRQTGAAFKIVNKGKENCFKLILKMLFLKYKNTKDTVIDDKSIKP